MLDKLWYPLYCTEQLIGIGFYSRTFVLFFFYKYCVEIISQYILFKLKTKKKKWFCTSWSQQISFVLMLIDRTDGNESTACQRRQ